MGQFAGGKAMVKESGRPFLGPPDRIVPDPASRDSFQLLKPWIVVIRRYFVISYGLPDLCSERRVASEQLGCRRHLAGKR